MTHSFCTGHIANTLPYYKPLVSFYGLSYVAVQSKQVSIKLFYGRSPRM